MASASTDDTKMDAADPVPDVPRSVDTGPRSAETEVETPATTSPANNGSGKWWHVRLFRGMINDVRRRAPYYGTDWKDAWDYRVVPATVYMYFANILPALAFSLDMFTSTGSSYGVNEVLLASVLGSVLFSLFACQPLVIVGVTGPITVFNYTVYDIMEPTGVNYLAFMCWIGIWSLILHWILAITNSCNWLRWVTRFPCDIFGFYVAFIYLQKGIQVLERLPDGPGFYLSIVAALLVFMVAYICGELGTSALFHHHIRVFLKDYGTPLTLIFFTGFVYIGRMSDVHLERLPTSVAFMPTADRDWLVDFWNISVGDIFLALPFAVLLTILFWFDHNVSSLIAQGTEFPLRKPPGFHWDFFLLGLAVGVAGILGLPFPNGLIPQAPFHTEALTVKKARPETDEKGNLTGSHVVEPSHVVEQRFSNLAQGLLTLGTMTGPLLVVLHLIPHGVLAGLFFVMGLLGFAVTFAITQTVAAVGFPVFIMLLIPVRALLLPKWFTVRELAALDEPTASPFIMENVGGAYGGPAAETDDMERAVSATAARRPSRRYSEQELRQRDGVFASPGAPRRSEEDVAERGMLTSTATRRSSRGAASSRAALSRVGSGGSKHD
ncbi:Bloom syndrome protein [Verticillium dahliae VDG1]|nr:Bloom syndrome protein [Verticillium dahliae VDG1]